MEALGEPAVARHVTNAFDEPTTASSAREALSAARVGAVVLLVLGVLGLWCLAEIDKLGFAVPGPGRENVFFRLYALHERPFLWAQIVCAAAILVSLLRVSSFHPAPMDRTRSRESLIVAAVALAVLLFSRIGTHAILQDTALSMDEYEGVFQARIFAAGHVTARVPDDWVRFAGALTPVWIVYLPDTRAWIASYLPVYAAIRAAFRSISLESWTGPFLAGLSVILTAGLARRLWPGRIWPLLFAAACLATSAQFLLTSMTAYAWPAHLFLNLLWLWLYMSNRRSAFLILPFVGVLALGAHYPVTHALFVAPFLVRAIRERRGWFVYWLSVYCLGSLVWWKWLETVHPYSREGGLFRFFGLPFGSQWLTQLMNLTLVFSWQTPVLLILCFAALRRFRELHPVLRDLALGIGVTLLAHLFVPNSQGHGWGFRYIYGVLGNFALLAAAGAVVLVRSASWLRAIIISSLAVSVAFQIPLRAEQAASFVRPFARTLQYLATLPFSVIVIDPAIGWYAQDLIRNGPFLGDEPKRISLRYLPPQGLEALQRRFDGRLHVLSAEELRELGIPASRAGSR